MKRSILTFIIITSIGLKFILAQDTSQKKSFIICIDGRIVYSTISKLEFIDSLTDGAKKLISANYTPGNLVMSASDYAILMSEKTKSIILSLTYSEYCNGQTEYHYDIDFKKGWLDEYIFVLYIYNTDKKKYKKLYRPITGKHYTYEYDLSGGGMRRATKVLVKDCD